MIIAWQLGLLFFGFFLLIKGADFLIKGASALAKGAHISEITIGLTIVSLGTSMPEIVVNILASSQGHSTMVFANVIGANIFNLFVILGIVGLIYPVTLRSQTVWKEIPILIVTTLLVFILTNDILILERDTNGLDKLDALFLILAYLLFMWYVFTNFRTSGKKRLVKFEVKSFSVKKIWLFIVGGSIATSFGGQLVVEKAIWITEYFSISQRLISLTVLATFTSLPELTTSVIAILRRNSDLAVGNIIGSSMFNFLLVLGLSSIFNDLPYTKGLNFDLNFFLFGVILLFLSMFTGKTKKLQRWEGFIFLIFFVAYLYFVFIRM
ncbi:calcium/sodium antiporter [Flexithrix dorotheae]|uniref:calcium/sodium antiporter n=1 Tax=Flexithrix dorotheae TaxID=70993 RepID=UPI0003634152|nr:calcium/sodium antiporter [Flexithrix dorotheae]